MIIEGSVAPGFESVRALYAHNMAALAERNTQLCVYVDGQCVVDLWGSAIDDEDFSADSLVNVFSSGKSLESIALAMLVDRDLLRYDAKIGDYWPEYGVNGKEDTTVADLMRHEAGLATFDNTLEPEHLQPEALRANAVGAVIERQAARYRAGPDSRREYHAITRGWIANELFRRVEPAGRTMGQFIREEISEPLGVDVYIGLQEEELARVSPVVLLGVGYQIAQGLLPRRLGRKIELSLPAMIAKLWRLRAGLRGRSRPKAPAPLAGMKGLSGFNTPVICKGEMPSAGAKCSARGLARLAALLAGGGALAGSDRANPGSRLLGSAAFEALHGAPVQRDMMGLRTTFSQGGLASFASDPSTDGPLDDGLHRGREGFVGWMGLGGSIFQWHPERNIGFAYVPTSLNVLDIVNERGKAYQAEVMRCLAERDGSSSAR